LTDDLLTDEQAELTDETEWEYGITLLSEAAFAEDWNRLEEDEAWAHLQSLSS